jgi:Icc-related predicted phosphoesterase
MPDQIENGELVGCENLQQVLLRVKSKFHVFGHIHECYGFIRDDRTTYTQLAVCYRMQFSA